MVVPALPMASAKVLKDAACVALDVEESEYVLMSFLGQQSDPISLEGDIKKTLIGLNLVDRQAVLLRRKDHPTEAATAQSARQAFLLASSRATGVNQSPDVMNHGALQAPAMTPTPMPAVAMSIDSKEQYRIPAIRAPVSPHSGSASPRLRSGTSPTFLSSSPLSRSFGRAPSWAEDSDVQVRRQK